MKILLNLFLFSLLISQLHGQQVTYRDISSSTEMEQHVRSWMGKRCDEVSSVQLIGHISTVARFRDSSLIHIRSGFAFSTGTFEYDNLWRDGDPDISASFNPSKPSFDAAGVIFTLNPQETDSIRIKFVFATDEDLWSQYDDKFLFLLSTNGGPYVNLAHFPSGSPISVSQMAASLNQSYTLDTPYLYGYNDYTIPLTVRFNAVAGNEYKIKIVIADIADGQGNSVVFVEEALDDPVIGKVTVEDGTPVTSGNIEFYEPVSGVIASPAFVLPVQPDGTFSKDSLIHDRYRLRYVPDAGITNYMPVYIGDEFLWHLADTFGSVCRTDTLVFVTKALPEPTPGLGTITGRVVFHSPFLGDSACEQATVFAVNVETGIYESAAKTDALGNYTISGLPDGVYRIVVDFPFLVQASYYEVLVNNAQSSVPYEVEDHYINGYIYRKPIFHPEFTIFPNPLQEQVCIQSEGCQDFPVRVYDIAGNLVFEEVIRFDTQCVTIPGLTEGIYFASLRGITHKISVVGNK